MRCDSAQAGLSAAMDDLRPVTEPVADHLNGCRHCRGFLAGAQRVRTLARFAVAQPVPDLVPSIMRKVRAEAAANPPRVRAPAALELGGQADYPLAPRRTSPRVRTVALGLAAGLVIGFTVTAGGLVGGNRGNTTALAAEIPRDLLGASASLSGYRATFDISELHWTKSVPVRTFVADLAFRAPEDFRVSVRDLTPYPSPAWPRNDLLLATDGRTWQASGPNSCPLPLLPACPQARPAVIAVRDRAPFDAETAMPTDVIVPMTVLAASDRVNVLGLDTIAGRGEVAVALAYRDATPLFDTFQFLGSWRPFFPQDRVIVWLDRKTWFPMRYQVFPAPGAERAAWSSRQGLPIEGPDSPIFSATARSFSTAVPALALFARRTPAAASDDGFHDRPVAAAMIPARSRAIQPASVRGLPLVRYGAYARSDSRPFDESVLAYARGLSWLTVTRVLSWTQGSPFGVGPFAESVELPHGGIGYYEPASASEPRRVALHTTKGEFLLASNLPRAELLAVARSVPVKGLPQPPSWLLHRWTGGYVLDGLTVDRAVRRAGFPLLLPRSLPTGYRPVAAEVTRAGRTNVVTISYRRPAAELDGVGLLLSEATGQPLPPATDADQVMVPLRATIARWSPDESRLEWVEGRTYVSLSASAFDLPELLAIAASLGAP